MKLLFLIVLLAACGAAVYWYAGDSGRPAKSASRTSIYALSFTSIDGMPVQLSAYRGKYLLIVNVASQCGFTPQYAGLEQLSKTYRDSLIVIGFPSNDFLGQEPGTDEEIKTFCAVRYGVTFPLARKGPVTGSGQSEVFRWLTDKAHNGWNDKSPKWNFYKYLVSPSGELLKVFPSTTSPMSADITEALR